jgi:hypothetical protein
MDGGIGERGWIDGAQGIDDIAGVADMLHSDDPIREVLAGIHQAGQ